eukprot:g11177.t1
MAAGGDRTALHGLEERLFKLVSRKATSVQWGEWLRAPLEHAMAEGDKDLTMTLLKAGANGGSGWKGCGGRTLLDAAAEGGNDDVVSTQLKAGGSADLNAVSGAKNMTALHRACRGGHTAAADTLLVEGADVDLVDSEERDALHYALQGGHQELAKHVLIAGANVNAEDHAGDTPLHLAAALEDDNLVYTLLRKGAGVNAANAKGQCALHIAVEHGRISSAEALLKAGADPNVRYTSRPSKIGQCSPLYLARRDSAMTKVLLRHGADLKALDKMGCTALHCAAASGAPDVIDVLVEGAADLEAKSLRVRMYGTYRFSGFTALHSATYLLENMAKLLEKRANINVTDDNGLTPLHVVCMTAANHALAVETADFLLRKGADETITDDDGNTPKDLIESGADPSGRLQRLLVNAPADRTWRRRGMLVLCRARSIKVVAGDGDGKVGKVPCHGKEVGAGAAAGGRGCVLTRMVGLEDKEVFRSIVMFL